MKSPKYLVEDVDSESSSEDGSTSKVHAKLAEEAAFQKARAARQLKAGDKGKGSNRVREEQELTPRCMLAGEEGGEAGCETVCRGRHPGRDAKPTWDAATS
jgi:hypothetical protein